MPPMAKRFLPTQEWSVEERQLSGEYGIAARCIVAATVAKSAAESPPFP